MAPQREAAAGASDSLEKCHQARVASFECGWNQSRCDDRGFQQAEVVGAEVEGVNFDEAILEDANFL